ncbi:MAG: hypothetical protein ACI9GE_000637 [Oceanospirillaceae bacterium]|jgi:hypothetical protein
MSNFNKRLPGLVMALVMFAFVYIGFNQYQANLNIKHTQLVPEFIAAGKAFGQLQDQQACLDETFRQNTGHTDFSSGVYYGKFLKACFQVAAPSADMCNDVPKFTENKDQASKDWLRDVCFDRSEANTCRLLMRQVQLQCSAVEY